MNRVFEYEDLIDFLIENGWCRNRIHARSVVPTDATDMLLVPPNLEIKLGIKEVLRISLIMGKSNPLILHRYRVTSEQTIGVMNATASV